MVTEIKRNKPSLGWIKRADREPEVGGRYLVGGYRQHETMPRSFETFFSSMHIDIEDGPIWSTYNAPSNVQVEYWMDIGPHPEHPEHDHFWDEAAFIRVNEGG